MNPRYVLYLLVALVFMFGSGYAAIVLSWLTPGPTVAVYADTDGPVTMTMGANLPRPQWIVLPAGAIVTQGSRVVSAGHPQGFGLVEIATRAALEDLRPFFLRELGRAGFETRDEGIAPLNAASAALVGLADTIVAERAATKDCVAVQIRTADGWLIPSRIVQISWYKTDAKFPGRSGDVCLGLATAARAVQAAR